jgi:hypothetical protein
VPLAGVKASLAGAPTLTVNAVLALVSPVADMVTVALPTVVGVKLEVAIPPLGATGDTGLNEPETPLTENVTAFVAVVDVFP